MRKVNSEALGELTWSSPSGGFAGAGKQISEALGRKPESTDLLERHPFDVEILRVSAGKTPYPIHSHSMQWEFYHVISGSGRVRHDTGSVNDGDVDLIVYVVADNPLDEFSPKRAVIRGEHVPYYDGEDS